MEIHILKNKYIEHLYVHVPYCKQFCDYCDFYKECSSNINRTFDKYLKQIEDTLNKYSQEFFLKSIYIGGGTPNVLPDDKLSELLKLLNKFKRQSIFEFSIELNPENITDSQLLILKNNNVNRISIGIQSSNELLLSTMNRYNGEKFLKNLSIARKYFNNISFDFIYNIPGQGINDLSKDIDIIKSYAPEHISWYSLIIKPNTPLAERISHLSIDLDYEYECYITKELSKIGYKKYEVCSFSKNNKFKSIHNSSYWDSKTWLGVGPSAASFLKNNNDYFLLKNSDNLISWTTDVKKLTTFELYEQVIMMGLRKTEGINLNNALNQKSINYFIDNIEKLILEKKLIKTNDFLKLSKKWFLLANDVYEEIFK